jgi:hypothetical protein
MTSKTQSRALIIAVRLLLLAMLCTASWFAIQYGLAWRRGAWDATDLIHFYSDVNNGLHWGSQGNLPPEKPRGFLNVYDYVAGSSDLGDDNSPNYGLDYAPLRLLLMTRWQEWLAAKYPERTQQVMNLAMMGVKAAWHPPYGYYEPLLRFNDAMEILGAIGLFLLARHWVVRGDRRWGSACPVGTWGAIRRPFRGCIAGLIAALLFWFNPAVILSTHGWPTWDEWIIPFFVWCVWLCCVEWWFTAGVVLAIGAMFKGQQLFVAPIFVLWPLLAGRPLVALRWLAGLAIGVALLASPWLLTYVPGGVVEASAASDRKIDVAAVFFVMTVALLLAMPALVYVWLRLRRHREAIADVPEPAEASRWSRVYEIFAARILPWAKLFYGPLAALAVAAALLLCADFFHGSLNWLYIGWGYGTRHYMHMTTGLSDNLAGLLDRRYGWHDVSEVVFTLNAYHIRLWPTHVTLLDDPTEISIRVLLAALYVIAFLVCVVGAAIQYRRNDPKFLVAITGVWLMFFTLLPQIHERYLLYAAGVGCSLTAVGGGFVLLDVFMTALTFIMTLHVMLRVARENGDLQAFGMNISPHLGLGASPTFGQSLIRFIEGTHPDAGWAVLLCAGIFLFNALAPSRKVRRWSDDTGAVEAAAHPGTEAQMETVDAPVVATEGDHAPLVV